MRWRKAHKNKRSVMLRAKKAKAAKKKLFAATGWREWLKMLGPEFWESQLYQESFVSHFWERARSRSVPYLYRRRIELPLLPTAEGLAISVSGDGVRGYRPFFIIVDDNDPSIVLTPPGFEERAREFWG